MPSKKKTPAKQVEGLSDEWEQTGYTTLRRSAAEPMSDDRAQISQDLQKWKRQSDRLIKRRIRVDNAAAADLVAKQGGYPPGATKAEMQKIFGAAKKQFAKIVKRSALAEEEQKALGSFSVVIMQDAQASRNYQELIDTTEEEIVLLMQRLPQFAGWVESIHGLGLLGVGKIVGEAGDLAKYPNPAKLWRRLGLAPFKGRMGATWKGSKKGQGLSAAEWSEMGYVPRRRSTVWNVASPLFKQTGPNSKHPDSIYRQVYNQARQRAKAAHPDWTDGHLHNHGLLLIGKRIVLHAWIVWNKGIAALEGGMDQAA